jgi:hypothetical protein
MGSNPTLVTLLMSWKKNRMDTPTVVTQGPKAPGGLMATKYTTEEMVQAIIGITIPALEK